jgi:hypothetical protein
MTSRFAWACSMRLYLSSNMKDNVYVTNSHTEEKLRESIRRETWKLLRKNFKQMPTYLNDTQRLCVYIDVIFSTSYNIHSFFHKQPYSPCKDIGSPHTRWTFLNLI